MVNHIEHMERNNERLRRGTDRAMFRNGTQAARIVVTSGIRRLWMTAAMTVLGVAPSVSQIHSSDLHHLRSVGDVQISPDGRHIAFEVIDREQPGRPSSRIWVYAVDSQRATPLVDGVGSNARWSPDGSWIAYIGRSENRSGVMIVRPDGSHPTLLAPVSGTNHPLPSRGDRLSWSRDGSQIAFVSSTPGPETPETSGDPIVITRYLYKPSASEGLTRFNDNRRLHIFAVDVATRDIRQLTDGTYYEHSIDWSPVGDEILFVSNREPDADRFFNYDIFTVNASSRTIRRLTSTESAEYRPRWSPDGQTIAFQGTRRGLTSSETTMEDTHIWLMQGDGSNRRELGHAVDNRQGAPQWTADGRFVYFTVQERGNVSLHRLGMDGTHAKVVDGIGSVGRWSPGADGALAYAFTAPTDMAQLYLQDGGSTARLTDLNGAVLNGRTIATVEPIRFLSFDAMEVEAFLTHPLQRRPGAKYPLIVMIKGGPHGQRGPRFDHKAQVYATHGWAALTVNYRGSTGYGQAFADAIFGDQDGGEAKDVLSGVRAVLRRYEWVDRARLGIEGGSYGGQLTNWIITQTEMFKAAIPIASIANLISFNYMAYYHDYLAVEFGAYPHQDDLMDRLWERSPLKHVARVKTPAMLVHGENDNDVPIAEAEQFYTALRDVGVEAVMVRYPREGHGVRETAHIVDLIDRSIRWYERHFSPAERREDIGK